MQKKVFILIAILGMFISIFTIKYINKPKSYELLFNWGISKEINNPERFEKALKIFGDVDFKKLSQLESSTGKYINYYEPFYNYKNHSFETIENIFEAMGHSDAADSDEIATLIFNLYKKEDTQTIVQSVINSKKEYKKIFDDIIEWYRSNNGL